MTERGESADRGIEDPAADDQRVAARAELLPEEESAGSDDRQAQAEAILADSDERTDHPEQAKRASTQTPD